MFNQASTAEERNAVLKDILQRGEEALGADVPSHAEVNVMIARSEEEIDMFEEMDKVGLFKSNAVDPQLESAWFQPVKLSNEKLLSSLCFQMQLVPLQQGVRGGVGDPVGARAGAADGGARVARRGAVAGGPQQRRRRRGRRRRPCLPPALLSQGFPARAARLPCSTASTCWRKGRRWMGARYGGTRRGELATRLQRQVAGWYEKRYFFSYPN